MTYIKALTDGINEEICDAKKYAEKAIEYKVKANNNRYKMYYEMANDELKHAKFLHDIVTEEIDRLRHTVTPPPDMVKAWEYRHREYVDKARWIKKMLEL